MSTKSKPDWLRVGLPSGEKYQRLKQLVDHLRLNTVCEEARCPNVDECWGGGTLTLMLMGDTCTRGCRFCDVKSGRPEGEPDPQEPQKVAWAIDQLDLTYVVLTSVDRDDLEDGGADHFASTVEEIKKRDEEVVVEVLIPDFQGDRDAIGRIVESGPEVIAHNVETTRSLTPRVRDPRAGYDQSLGVLRLVKEMDPSRFTKSSVMIGLGETKEEVVETMRDLRAEGVDVLTVGQYLRPSKKHLEVEEYVPPETFDEYERIAKEMGFLYVASGPLVRSSYKAGEYFMENAVREGRKPTKLATAS